MVLRKASCRFVLGSRLVPVIGAIAILLQAQMAQANTPPADGLSEYSADEYPADIDIPEEILRTEIIVEARSPLTGELLTASEYAQLQASLEREGRPPQLNSDIRQLIYLLRLRRILRPIIPFLKEQPIEQQAVGKQQIIEE